MNNRSFTSHFSAQSLKINLGSAFRQRYFYTTIPLHRTQHHLYTLTAFNKPIHHLTTTTRLFTTSFPRSMPSAAPVSKKGSATTNSRKSQKTVRRNTPTVPKEPKALPHKRQTIPQHYPITEIPPTAARKGTKSSTEIYFETETLKMLTKAVQSPNKNSKRPATQCSTTTAPQRKLEAMLSTTINDQIRTPKHMEADTLVILKYIKQNIEQLHEDGSITLTITRQKSSGDTLSVLSADQAILLQPKKKSKTASKSETKPSATTTPAKPVIRKALTTATTTTTVIAAQNPTNIKSPFKNAQKPTNHPLFKDYIKKLSPMKVPDDYQIVCTKSKTVADKTLKAMISEGTVFGVDMEWRPSFIKNQPENPTGLIQICGQSKILLIQQSQMEGLPDELVKFFRNKNLYKTGVSIRGDGLKLHRDFGIKANGLLDLAPLAESAFKMAPELQNYNKYSLQALAAIFLQSNLKKSKRVQLSDWNTQHLNKNQIEYASIDAYTSYALYQPLMDISKLEKSDLTLHHLSLEDDL